MRQTLLRFAGLAAFFILCAGAVGFLLESVGTHVGPGQKFYDVRVQVPTAVALAAHADVRQAGIKIGQVSKLEAGARGPVLTLELEKSHAPIYKDASVFIREKSIAAENYVSLNPGSPAAGGVAANGLLSMDHVREATQPDDIFSILNRVKRRDVARIARGAGNGLKGHGGRNLNSTLEGLSGTVDQAQPLAAVLAAERNQFAGLVDSFGRVTLALGERRTALQLLTTRAKAAAVAVDARNAQLRASLARFPGFLTQARQTAAKLESFSGNATPVMSDLAAATEDLVPATEDLRPGAAAGRRAVQALGRFSTAIRPVTAQLPSFSAAGTRFVGPFSDFLRQLNPLVSYLKPYHKDLGQFFANTGAATDLRDPVSHVGRIITPISRDNLPSVLSKDQEDALKKVLAPLDSRGNNAYPNPGTSGSPQAGSRNFRRLQPDPRYTKSK